MSRIGKKPVPVGTAKVNLSGQVVKVEGPKGKLELTVHKDITVTLDETKTNLVVTRKDDQRQSRALHGLTRALVANMVEGVVNGYKKSLEIQGVGFKAEIKGTLLLLSVGYANQLSVEIPGNLTVQVDATNHIHVAGADKQAVGEFAARVRKLRKPEPYKGKGIRYVGEVVKIKAGKAFAGAGAK